MEWTEDDRKALLTFRDIIDSDNIKLKRDIKKKLLNNKFIIHVLNNKELELSDAEPEDYFGINIKDYYILPDTNVDNQHYICYTTSFDEMHKYNKTMKYMEITFTILCYVRNITDKETGLARHDLLGALINHEFNFYPFNGGRFICVSDKETVVDSNYSCRTIIFQQDTDNTIVKTNMKTGIPSIINKKVNFDEI